MQTNAVGQRRLANQQISRPSAAPVEAIVAQPGAVQAQEYQSTLWARGLRSTAGLQRRSSRHWPNAGLCVPGRCAAPSLRDELEPRACFSGN